MMTKEQKDWLKSHTTVRLNEPMSLHTTFKIGGMAEAYVTPTEEELVQIVTFGAKNDIPVTVLGNGSNVLVSDDGIAGIVVSISRPMSQISIEGERITVQAGAMLAAVARAAGDEALAGLEFAGGIPGSVGGAVVMNAGAYSGQISDVLRSVRVLNEDGGFVNYTADELELGYRHSIFMEEAHRDEIMVSAEFELVPGDRYEIVARMEDYNARRRDKQPLEYPSAGSTFKRPEGYFAGKLIQESGLAGYTVGGASVSEKHCGFVINTGGASAADVKALISHVQSEVERRFGVHLEKEVQYIG